MTLLRTINLFGGFMGNTVDILMTVLAFVAAVRTTLKEFIVDVKKPEFPFLINPAQTTVFVAEQAIEFFFSGFHTFDAKATKNDAPT